MHVALRMHLEFYHRRVRDVAMGRVFPDAREIVSSGERAPWLNLIVDPLTLINGRTRFFLNPEVLRGSGQRTEIREDDPILDRPAILQGYADARTIAHRKIED